MLEREAGAGDLCMTRRTTWRASLESLLLATNDRYCDLEAVRAALNADRTTRGAILEAIIAMWRRNGWEGGWTKVFWTFI
jgi:hypothetical protein